MRRRPRLDTAAAAAITAVLDPPKYEVIPLKNVYKQAEYLPQGGSVSVTASPAKGCAGVVIAGSPTPRFI